MILLGLDPGTKNFGYTRLKITPKNKQVQRTGILKNPIKNLTGKEFAKDMNAFQEEIDMLTKGVNQIAAERFQTRGPKGKLIECVSIMLGAIAAKHPKITLFVASQWKNSFTKSFRTKKRIKPLEVVYAWAKKHKMPLHIIDSCFIALYSFGNNSFNGIAWKELPLIRLRLLWSQIKEKKINESSLPLRRKRATRRRKRRV